MKFSRNLKILTLFAAIIAVTIPFLFYNYSVQNPILWELKITGNVNQEITIQYQQIVNGTFGLVEDRPFFFKNSYGTEYWENYTGASLWQILNQTGVLPVNATQFYFRSVDNWVTNPLLLDDISAHPDFVLIAFKLGDEILLPKDQGGNGPLRAIVDYNLTKPNVNSEYWAKYVNTVIII
jgi:DMSO/TMAO reductase YedYZ molybdopterin-dependent catalytic subunit